MYFNGCVQGDGQEGGGGYNGSSEVLREFWGRKRYAMGLWEKGLVHDNMIMREAQCRWVCYCKCSELR